MCLDGPDFAGLAGLAVAVRHRLQTAGRRTDVIDAKGFYRDASLRLEYGRTDAESFYRGWLDEQSLRREVLSPLGGGRPPSYLPSLRDPVTNRSTRAEPVTLADDAVLIVHGQLLLGQGLDFDLTMHADISRAARRRRIAEDWAWTLPAFDRYDVEVDPCLVADIVVRFDDPQRPALRMSR